MNENLSSFSPLAAAMILATVVFGVFLLPENKEPEPEIKISHKPVIQFSFAVPMPNKEYLHDCRENRAKAKLVMYNHNEFMEFIDSFELQTCDIVMESLGTYYITGYTSSECGGSVMTASGATVHKASYANRLTEPTTCAIDPYVHDFGDLFYIPAFDTVYVAEDTGSAVKGKHLDLYFFDSEYSYAMSITGKYEVYSVEYIYGTVPAKKYDVRPLVWEVMNEKEES